MDRLQGQRVSVEMCLKEKIEDLCKRNGIAELYAFGSRGSEIGAKVRGCQAVFPIKPASDVDIAAVPCNLSQFGPLQRVSLAIALEDLFDASRVDLVVLPEADPFLALDVIRGELLYGDDLDRQARYELYVLRRAADLMPLKKERKRMILEEATR